VLLKHMETLGEILVLRSRNAVQGERDRQRDNEEMLMLMLISGHVLTGSRCVYVFPRLKVGVVPSPARRQAPANRLQLNAAGASTANCL
jgi:hypothetical protein